MADNLRDRWDFLRVRRQTKQVIAAEKEYRTRSYETGRSRRGPWSEQFTEDQIVLESILFVRAERARKNRTRKRNYEARS